MTDWSKLPGGQNGQGVFTGCVGGNRTGGRRGRAGSAPACPCRAAPAARRARGARARAGVPLRRRAPTRGRPVRAERKDAALIGPLSGLLLEPPRGFLISGRPFSLSEKRRGDRLAAGAWPGLPGSRAGRRHLGVELTPPLPLLAGLALRRARARRPHQRPRAGNTHGGRRRKSVRRSPARTR